jgi:hypothetical protein
LSVPRGSAKGSSYSFLPYSDPKSLQLFGNMPKRESPQAARTITRNFAPSITADQSLAVFLNPIADKPTPACALAKAVREC